MSEVPRSLWRRWSLVGPAVVLVAAVAVQGLSGFRETPRTRELHLARRVPSAIPGWQGRDVPLGPNEFVANAATKILNYDDYVNREFVRTGQRFGVYVAYWGPGKMPTRFVASHTPDRCWTENGWRCLEMKFRERRTVAGTALLPGEWRVFAPPDGGPPTYVLYWHLVDGKPSVTSGRFNAIPDPVDWWKDTVQQVLRGSREQYFVRLTCNVPLEMIWDDRGVREVLRELQGLALGADPQKGVELMR